MIRAEDSPVRTHWIGLERYIYEYLILKAIHRTSLKKVITDCTFSRSNVRIIAQTHANNNLRRLFSPYPKPEAKYQILPKNTFVLKPVNALK